MTACCVEWRCQYNVPIALDTAKQLGVVAALAAALVINLNNIECKFAQLSRFMNLLLVNLSPVKAAAISLVLLLIGTNTAPNPAMADASRDATKLIELTNIGEQFELVRQQQTRTVIRTYASIVSTELGLELPAAVKEAISLCYEQNYDWANFEDGIVEILLENFTEKEMRLLLDFYRNKGLPPSKIDAFRDIVAKGELIQRLGAEHIFAVTVGCVDLGTEAVLTYLREKP
jgi:hypothetical protein|tara:strand:+ start:16720 stop:17412 length:693 start_codon:yes stop_codon:yes gene_type:complete